MEYRISKAIITNYQLTYWLNSEARNAHNILKLKCYLPEEMKSIKFVLPAGEERIQQFLIITKAENTDKLYNKEFQILYSENHIYGLSNIGEKNEVKYIPATPYEYGTTEEQNKMLNFEALHSFMAECVHTGKKYFIEIE